MHVEVVQNLMAPGASPERERSKDGAVIDQGGPWYIRFQPLFQALGRTSNRCMRHAVRSEKQPSDTTSRRKFPKFPQQEDKADDTCHPDELKEPADA